MKYEVGAKIKEYREKKGLSQKELAQLMGLGNTRVSNWELGISRPDVNMLSLLCKALDVSTDDLLGLEGQKNTPPPGGAGGISPTRRAVEDIMSKMTAEELLQLRGSALTILAQRSQEASEVPLPKNP